MIVLDLFTRIRKISFESKLFLEICQLFQNDKISTLPYYLYSDRMAERMNQTMKEMLSKYTNSYQTDWNCFVDGIVFADNTNLHETTRLSSDSLFLEKSLTVKIFSG